MYAIIEDSGTRSASVGDEITIDLRDIADDASSITFDRILAIGGDDAKFGSRMSRVPRWSARSSATPTPTRTPASRSIAAV